MTTSSPPGRPETSFLGRWGSAVCAALLAVLIAIPVASRLDPIVGDLAVLEFMPSEQVSDTDIVIVTITEDTLASFPYRSPIDRRFLAELLVSLDAAGPAGIGIDVLFDSPSEPEKDAGLLQVLDDLATPVVLATVPASLLTEKQAAYLSSVVERRQPGSVILQRDDADGILRHLPVNDGETPLFTEALANQRFEKTPFDSRILYPALSADDAGPFPRYPAHTVAFLPQDWFSGKYVLIGTDLPGTDRHATPLASLQGVQAGNLPGIEIHAHVLAQLLSGRALAVPTFAQSIGLLVLFAGVSALVFTIFRQPKVFFTGFVICLSIYGVVAWGLMQAGTALLPVLGPVTAASASVFLLALVRWRQDRLERAFVVSAFEKYVSPEVVRRLATGEVELALGGEKRLVTYVFTDLAGFTTLSEELPPDRVAEILNGYLDEVCDVVFRHGATLDKLIGDAVVCFLGAPEDDPAQAKNAVALAVELDQTAEQYRKSLLEQGVSLGVTRIGAHCGDAVIGNFGGHRFFDYTGIGDTVNTAARLEGANKYLGSRICVSQTVLERFEVNTDFVFRPLGEVVLKGRQQTLGCFEPSPKGVSEETWFQDYITGYDQLNEDTEVAKTLFERVLAIKSDDGPSRFHLDRLEKGLSGTKVVLSEK
ncbi:adenylate/guanylate cyclase domain-containing protein [Roseibium alexandrii]|uniref:Adenylate cyclase, family 3 (Some protein containing HAMP domain) n=1 Tax=Roseibium alexandrii (strain DSM 17067 / NCIMB 14079 / DFL-11) TaxID=244592 RepID=A0A5E8H2M5_ROSAD|nr:adenylate/guanylate cyclase domain-containing protein [Roseibium alexandrii]EEE46647.1 Adenylate cyclase, family 3 (some protein containing HAMP domain) [Roseibium alexandrii DFL-11]